MSGKFYVLIGYFRIFKLHQKDKRENQILIRLKEKEKKEDFNQKTEHFKPCNIQNVSSA